MAAIRAGVLNQGLGQFHGAGYYRNANYHSRVQAEPDKADSAFDSDSEDSSRDSQTLQNLDQNYQANLNLIEKHRVLLAKKHDHIESIEKKLKFLDVAIVLLGAFGLFIAHTEAELFYTNNNSPVSASNLYRSLVTISTICLLALIIIHSKLDYLITRERREAAEEEVPDFYLSMNFKILALELCINAVHCPPGINKVFVSDQLGGVLTISLNDICAACMLLRVYLLTKLFRHFTKWTTAHSKDTCRIFGAEASTTFAMKAILKESPIFIVIPVVLILMTVFAVAIRLFERGFIVPTSIASAQDYTYIWNSMWLVMLTMTTVGYGDFYPRTHVGRFIIVLAALGGIFMISLIVITLTNFVLFSSEESRSFDYINKVKALEASKKFARLFIKTQLQQYLYYRRARGNSNVVAETEAIHLLSRFYYKKFKEYQTAAKFGDIGADELLTVLNERISTQVSFIKKNLNNALKVHDSLNLALTSQSKVKDCLDSSIKALQELKRVVYN